MINTGCGTVNFSVQERKDPATAVETEEDSKGTVKNLQKLHNQDQIIHSFPQDRTNEGQDEQGR